MNSGVYLRGYAAPFDVEVRLGQSCVIESFAPGAFDLDPVARIDARIGHEGEPFASTSWKTLRLFQNAFGLAFEADLQVSSPMWSWALALRDESLGVSVNFRHPPFSSLGRWSAQEREGGDIHVRHENCRIDHIALELNPAYRDTIAWLSTWEDGNVSLRMRQAMNWWSRGADPTLKPLPIIEAKQSVRKSAQPGPATSEAAIKAPPTSPPRGGVIWDAGAGVWRRERPATASPRQPYLHEARAVAELQAFATRLPRREGMR